LDKELLHNKIVRDIIASIFSGVYKIGDKLPAERTLSLKYDVSRGTVREALSSLQKIGVVAVKHGSGIYVQEISGAQIPNTFLPPDFENISLEDILIARNAIEQAAIELACRNIKKAELAEIKTLLDKMEASINYLPDFLQADMDFHYAIIKASKNMALLRAFEAIYEYHRYSQIYTTQRAGDESAAMKFHRKIVESLENRDAQSAKEAVGRHLAYMKKAMDKEK
jgi:GntR family transcriptional repressor for pyruvate dehydrogenase complex